MKKLTTKPVRSPARGESSQVATKKERRGSRLWKSRRKKLKSPIHQRKSPQEIVFSESSAYFQSLITDIDNAKKSIDLETYIFEKDTLGKRIAQHIKDAALRGVKARILVDGAGSPFWGGGFVRQLEQGGVQTRIFHPFPWQVWQWSRSVMRVPILLKAIYLLLKSNARNHRKVCLIDKEIAYVSSANISQCHLKKSEGGAEWRDTGIRIENLDTTSLSQAFEIAWDHIHVKERLREIFRHIYKNPSIRLNHTWHRRRALYKNLLRRIKHTKKRIWITNAYFVPDNFLLKHIKDAAQKGIDVRILLPRNSDVLFMPWASSTFYISLLKSGVRIFEYLPSVLHTKTLILDDWITVGSSNLNHRSLLHDLEVDINLKRSESKQAIENQFLQDLHHAKEISLTNWKNRPLYQRTLGHLLLYAKYWI